MDNDQESMPKTRIIQLDLVAETFPKWVAEESDENLLEVFRLGVAVRDSVTMRFSGNQKYVDEVLEAKLIPVYQKVDNMVEKFSQQAEMVRELKPEVGSVSDKVQTQIRDSQLDLSQKLRSIEDSLKQISTLHVKPNVKGAIGERKVLSILKDGLPHYGFKDISSQGRQCDIRVDSPASGHKYLIEVKNYQWPVGAGEIQKFEKDVRENGDFRVGIIFSLKSGLARRALHGQFEVMFDEDQFFIYVPNALKDENLIIWSVLLADELANLQQGLSDTQVGEIQNLHREFQENMERSKKCRRTLKTLQRTVQDMEENLVPLLDITDRAKNALNKALHYKRSSRCKEHERFTQSQLRQDFFDEAKQTIIYGKRSRTKSPLSPRSQTMVESGSVKIEENEENINGTKQRLEEAETSADNAESNFLQTSPTFPPLVTIDDD